MSELSVEGNATSEEVAAVVAAIQLQLADERASAENPAPDPWIRAARLEGVGRRQQVTFGHGWER